MLTLRSLVRSLPIALTMLFTGCASLSSQVIDIHPELQVSRQLNKDIRIDVQAKDLRTNKVIGYRATDKAPRPEIVLKDSVALLKHTTEHALEDMGIRRFFKGEYTMEINLVSLNYQIEKYGLKQTARVDMKINVTLTKGSKRYTGSYTNDKTQTFVGTPSEQENLKLINALVTENMNLMVNDKQLLDFIQFN
ncbi:YajG family lipoprotein [Neptuniibacter pectenicola]|uniref:YajG family lipoprotein n=1 Tax=Neptuniibacter pectenicola TaxID=1806669 RepID=A0ABU9TQZ1_9GAMM